MIAPIASDRDSGSHVTAKDVFTSKIRFSQESISAVANLKFRKNFDTVAKSFADRTKLNGDRCPHGMSLCKSTNIIA